MNSGAKGSNRVGRYSLCALLAGVLAATPAMSAAQRPEIGAGRIAAQVSLGALSLPIGFVAGGLLGRQAAMSLGASTSAASRAGALSGAAGAALSAAAVAAALGSSGPASGSFLAAVGGAVAGEIGSYALVRIHRRGDYATRRCSALCRVSFAAIALLPSTGAALAFNATRSAD